MSLKKQEVKPTDYIETGSKKVDGKAYAIKTAQQLSKGRLLWLTVQAFKFELMATGNVVLVLNWAFPAWPQIVLGLFGK